MRYKYETHLHTREASACGKSWGEEYPAFYKELGYSGIFVTDHFFNGNCAVPSYKRWEDMVHAFCAGYENAKVAGDKIGFPVYFGWEANFDGDEYLIYGLDKQWLLEHPDLLSYDRHKQYEVIHADGGLVVQAHPYRERNYLNKIYLNPNTCDAAEGFNAGNPPYQNKNAEAYCREYGLFMTAGSDIHRVGVTETGLYFGMEFDHPINSAKDYVQAILAHEGEMIVPGELRLKEDEDWVIDTLLPVVVNE